MNKKEIIFLTLIAAVLLGGFFAVHKGWIKKQGVQQENTTESWKTYQNKEYGFEVKYPGSWKLYSSSDWPGTITSLVSPEREHCCPGPPPNITISFSTNTEKRSFKEWFVQRSPDADWQLATLQQSVLSEGQTAYTVEVPGPADKNLATYVEWGEGFLVFSMNDSEGDTLPFWQDILHSLYKGKQFNSLKITNATSFVDSKGNRKRVFIYNTFQEDGRVRVYIANDALDRESATILVNDVFSTDDMLGSPYVSPGKLGSKTYIVITRAWGDNVIFTIADEDGAIITESLNAKYSQELRGNITTFKEWVDSHTLWARTARYAEGEPITDLLVDARSGEILERVSIPFQQELSN